ncbi:hypothetical protein F0365_08210 [Nonlabens sp. Ci31]|uniref:hypothetical protein n=1 Tax=Nonlabens sp. Ci31 TaxID=2608253 RepID=UPI001462D08E|nr:hypothetical protein [Nonlabens sp. Ci31]QJP34380.1 hypothetical protein F0365_08210 [Nonlabens sp. Ci31]
MDIFYTPSVVIGPLRLLLFILFIYGLNIIAVRRVSASRGLDYFMLRYPLFISGLVMITLVLTQLNAYDIIVILVILLSILLLIFLNLNFKKSLRGQFKEIKKRLLLYLLIKKERREFFLDVKGFNKKFEVRKSINDPKLYKYLKWQVGVGIALAILAFASRYYFFYFDSYLLSDIWYSDLAIIKDINHNQYFFHSGTMMGESSLISFYSDITGITHANALISYGLIENALLTVSLFWFVNKITSRPILPGLITALSFILLYPLLPLNINQLTESKPIFTGLSIMLPYIIYALQPVQNFENPKKFFYHMLVLSFGIINIDFMLGIFILPVIVLTASLYNWRESHLYSLKLLWSYVLALGITALIYFISASFQNYDLLLFIKSNLYSSNTYSYLPQLLFKTDVLYQIAIGVVLVVAFITAYLSYRKKASTSLFIVSLLLLSFFLLNKINFYFIDIDILNQLLAPSICILIGITVFVSYSAFYVKIPMWSKMLLTTCAIVSVFLFMDNGTLVKFPKKNLVNEQIIRIYDKMGTELLPYSYTVVNNEKNSRLGEGRHFFTNYREFNENYLVLDSTYHLYRNNYNYLKANPDAVIPNSAFVFIYTKQAIRDQRNNLDFQEQEVTLKIIEKLRKRGRTVNLYRKSSQLEVFEIINEPKSNKVVDLLL